ncbi:hypothetical protein BZL30_8493 [Mycobacterium kansasii]|uniref:YcaO domain-containing protein n=1 Tax=Mycobacterium kansasii TaxID=1768 RepID=A0A1V3WH77_MYCKA|nr:hypothetical protein BZL30_8493 [Mycobacterium kansasii]
MRPPDLDGADCAGLVDQVHRAGSQLRIARLDVWQGYYCFAAELISPTSSVQFAGSGLHHDPNVALSRAITEAAQSRLTAISGTREDIPATIYERLAEAPASAADHRPVCRWRGRRRGGYRTPIRCQHWWLQPRRRLRGEPG